MLIIYPSLVAVAVILVAAGVAARTSADTVAKIETVSVPVDEPVAAAPSATATLAAIPTPTMQAAATVAPEPAPVASAPALSELRF